jgi:hypothetical protein
MGYCRNLSISGFYPAMLQENVGLELTVVLSIMAISWWVVPFGDASAALSLTEEAAKYLYLQMQ